MKKKNTTYLVDLINHSHSVSEQYLVIRLGLRWYGICIEHIQEIIRIVAFEVIPESAAKNIGVINYRGEAINILNLWNVLKEEQSPLSLDKAIIILNSKNLLFGILVDEIQGVLSLDVQPRPDDLDENVISPLVTDVAFNDENIEMILILNPTRLHVMIENADKNPK